MVANIYLVNSEDKSEFSIFTNDGHRRGSTVSLVVFIQSDVL